MAEIMGKMGKIEKEIKRLRHHVSVLSKRNHRLMKDGKNWAASSITSEFKHYCVRRERRNSGPNAKRGIGIRVGRSGRWWC